MAVEPQFKMQVGTAGVAGAAHAGDQLAFLDADTTGGEGAFRQVGIEGLPAVIMIDHDQVAIAAI